MNHLVAAFDESLKLTDGDPALVAFTVRRCGEELYCHLGDSANERIAKHPATEKVVRRACQANRGQARMIILNV